MTDLFIILFFHLRAKSCGAFSISELQSNNLSFRQQGCRSQRLVRGLIAVVINAGSWASYRSSNRSSSNPKGAVETRRDRPRGNRCEVEQVFRAGSVGAQGQRRSRDADCGKVRPQEGSGSARCGCPVVGPPDLTPVLQDVRSPLMGRGSGPRSVCAFRPSRCRAQPPHSSHTTQSDVARVGRNATPDRMGIIGHGRI